MARGQMPSLTSVGVMPNVSSTVLGSRPESHCHRLQIGLLHRLEPPRFHVKHMLSPPCGMVSGNFPATSDKPLHCQEPSPIMTPSCRGDDLLFAFDVIACCYLVFIGMTRTGRAPTDLHATADDGCQLPRGRRGSWWPLRGSLRRAPACWSCGCFCRSNTHFVIWMKWPEACSCCLWRRRRQSATRRAHILF